MWRRSSCGHHRNTTHRDGRVLRPELELIEFSAIASTGLLSTPSYLGVGGTVRELHHGRSQAPRRLTPRRQLRAVIREESTG
jgi:hypothetical protein